MDIETKEFSGKSIFYIAHNTGGVRTPNPNRTKETTDVASFVLISKSARSDAILLRHIVVLVEPCAAVRMLC